MGKTSPEVHRRAKLKTHGLTVEQYTEILKAQQYKCAICKIKASAQRKALAIDHNHKTNQRRGLLCDKCNRGLGFFNDDYYLMRKAYTYLWSWRGSKLPYKALTTSALTIPSKNVLHLENDHPKQEEAFLSYLDSPSTRLAEHRLQLYLHKHRLYKEERLAQARYDEDYSSCDPT